MSWIYKYWAKIGGILACGIILFVLFSGMKPTDIKALLWFHFSILLLHQFEEYIFPGGFQDFFDKTIQDKNLLKVSLNDKGVILVNIVLGWTAYFLSAISGARILWLAVGILGITISNGMIHTIMFIIKRRYVPGVITGLLLFIPFGIYVLLKILEISTIKDVISGILVFIIGTASIPITILITGKKS